MFIFASQVGKTKLGNHHFLIWYGELVRVLFICICVSAQAGSVQWVFGAFPLRILSAVAENYAVKVNKTVKLPVGLLNNKLEPAVKYEKWRDAADLGDYSV